MGVGDRSKGPREKKERLSEEREEREGGKDDSNIEGVCGRRVCHERKRGRKNRDREGQGDTE